MTRRELARRAYGDALAVAEAWRDVYEKHRTMSAWLQLDAAEAALDRAAVALGTP